MIHGFTLTMKPIHILWYISSRSKSPCCSLESLTPLGSKMVDQGGARLKLWTCTVWGTLLLLIVLLVSEWLANAQVRSQPLQSFPKSGECSMRGVRESQCVLSCNLWYKHGMRRSCASETKTQPCIISLNGQWGWLEWCKTCVETVQANQRFADQRACPMRLWQDLSTIHLWQAPCCKATCMWSWCHVGSLHFALLCSRGS